MINVDDAIKERIKLHSLGWPQVSDHPYRIVIMKALDLEK